MKIELQEIPPTLFFKANDYTQILVPIISGKKVLAT